RDEADQYMGAEERDPRARRVPARRPARDGGASPVRAVHYDAGRAGSLGRLCLRHEQQRLRLRYGYLPAPLEAAYCSSGFGDKAIRHVGHKLLVGNTLNAGNRPCHVYTLLRSAELSRRSYSKRPVPASRPGPRERELSLPSPASQWRDLPELHARQHATEATARPAPRYTQRPYDRLHCVRFILRERIDQPGMGRSRRRHAHADYL